MTTPLPLAGVRILDFTWVGAGPLCTKMLADHGAEVIRVESTVRPDQVRSSQPFVEGGSGLNVSGFFADFNSSKLGITLNLKTPAGLTLARRLALVSDVVIDNYTAGTMERLGLGDAGLRALKPGLIVVSMSVMGQHGPKRDYGGWGQQIQCMAGINSITGFPGRTPTGPGGPYPDFSANPYHAVVAILSALRHRDRTGLGTFVDLAQYESTLSFATTLVMEYVANGTIAPPQGNRVPWAAPHGVYPCAGDDRWVAIAVENDAQWDGLCRAVDGVAWARDARFATLLGRLEHQDGLDALLSAWTQSRQAEDVMARLQDEGVPAGVCQTIADLLDDPQLAARHHFWEVEHPEMGHVRMTGQAVQLQRTPYRVHRPAPLLGEHTEVVCRTLLGLNDDEITQAALAGAFE